MILPALDYYSREEFILNWASGKKVLHLGCVGDRALGSHEESLHVKLARVSAELWGVDLNAEGILQLGTALPELSSNLAVGDACNLRELGLPSQFEVVIAGDLIEHLVHPAALFSSVESTLAPGGRMILSTPNALGLLNVLRAWSGQEKINPTHTCWFSISTLQELTRRMGWKVEIFATAYDFEPRGKAERLKYAFGKFFFRRFPQWGGTLLAVAKPFEDRRPMPSQARRTMDAAARQ